MMVLRFQLIFVQILKGQYMVMWSTRACMYLFLKMVDLGAGYPLVAPTAGIAYKPPGSKLPTRPPCMHH